MLYRNPLRCFRKPFSVFLVFIAAVDLYNGIVVCCGGAVTRLLCAFGVGNFIVPQEGETLMILGYMGVKSSILLVTSRTLKCYSLGSAVNIALKLY